jgi:hypothetical protein
MSAELKLYMLLLVIVVGVLALIDVFITKKYQQIPKWLSRGFEVLKAMLIGIGGNDGDKTLDELIKEAGYAYNTYQDIFYSVMDPWQRSMGYCSLYDEAAAPMGMIIDCEPIYFSYAGKRWLIEFWKGQYDLATGCEVGVYTTKDPDLDIPGFFRGPFFQCASNEDLLPMSYTLKKRGKILFRRKALHWWLTGFILGEFSEPSELTMDINITLKDRLMVRAFVEGLKNAGYSEDKFTVYRHRVSLTFDKPRTKQPSSRREDTDWIIQRKNKLLCDEFQKLTEAYNKLPDKVKAMEEQSPELYNAIANIGKAKGIFSSFQSIQKYLR